MARKKYGKQVGKIVAAFALLLVIIVGLSYGSLVRGMDQAAAEYSRGDVDAALQQYAGIEQRLRSMGAIRLIPGKDRRNLILNQARLLYAQDRYDEAQDEIGR